MFRSNCAIHHPSIEVGVLWHVMVEYVVTKKKEILTEIELFRKFQPRMS